MRTELGTKVIDEERDGHGKNVSFSLTRMVLNFHFVCKLISIYRA